MAGRLNILYRGPLSSCNYGCEYCPFAKRHETAAELRRDRECLERFVKWAGDNDAAPLGILFTPWGEALARRWYREAITQLSRLEHVVRVAAQTNLSCQLDWLGEADSTSVALWATYHPGETDRSQFLRQCARLQALSVNYSVGVVGLKEHLEEISAIRDELPDDVYVWVNAYKRVSDYYHADERAMIESIDPLFPFNAVRHPSHGSACRTGESAITVDGDGDMRRCHFVDEVIGNIYHSDWRASLRPRLCPAENCGCHIGYVHLAPLQLDEVFGEGVLERIPKQEFVRKAGLAASSERRE